MTITQRTAIITVFCAYIGFVLAGLAFYEMVDDSPFAPMMGTHLDLLAAWVAVEGGSAIALLAVAVGGVPIGLMVLVRAWIAKRKDLLLLMSVPVIALLTLGAFVLVVAAITTGFFTTPNKQPAIEMVSPWVPTAFVGLFLLAAIGSVAAVCLAIVRSDVGEHTFK